MGIPKGYKGIYTSKTATHCTSNGQVSKCHNRINIGQLYSQIYTPQNEILGTPLQIRRYRLQFLSVPLLVGWHQPIIIIIIIIKNVLI